MREMLPPWVALSCDERSAHVRNLSLPSTSLDGVCLRFGDIRDFALDTRRLFAEDNNSHHRRGFGRGAEGWLRPGLYGGTYDLAGQSRRRRNRGRYASGSPRIARNHKAATLIPHAGSPHDFISVVSGAGLPRAQADDADDERRVSRGSGELHPLRFVLTCNVRFWPLADISCCAAYVCFRG